MAQLVITVAVGGAVLTFRVGWCDQTKFLVEEMDQPIELAAPICIARSVEQFLT